MRGDARGAHPKPDDVPGPARAGARGTPSGRRHGRYNKVEPTTMYFYIFWLKVHAPGGGACGSAGYETGSNSDPVGDAGPAAGARAPMQRQRSTTRAA